MILNVMINVHRIKRTSSTHICNKKNNSPMSTEKKAAAGKSGTQQETHGATMKSFLLLMSRNIKCNYLCRGWGNVMTQSIPAHVQVATFCFICLIRFAPQRQQLCQKILPTPAFGQIDLLQQLHMCSDAKMVTLMFDAHS